MIKLNLLYFESSLKHGKEVESFYLTEIKTLDVTNLLNSQRRITQLNITASKNGLYLTSDEISLLKNLGEFNTLFKNDEFDIQDCEIHLEGGLQISSHDDGEVKIEYLSNSEDSNLIFDILQQKNLNERLIYLAKEKPSTYIEFDSHSKVLSEYSNFDDFLNSKGY